MNKGKGLNLWTYYFDIEGYHYYSFFVVQLRRYYEAIIHMSMFIIK